MTNRFFRKVDGNMLAPLHEETEQWLAKQPTNKQFKANMKSTRNPGHHRKMFAMLELVLDNHPRYTEMEDLLLDMKLRSGHYVEHVRAGSSDVAAQLRQWVIGVPGEPDQFALELIDAMERQAKLVYIPKSISFDKMGQEEFEEIYDRWVSIACDQLGISDRALRRELAEFSS